MKVSLLIAGFFSIFSFGESDFAISINQWRFQIYLFLTFVFVYSLCKRLYFYSFMSFLFLLLNFFAISSAVSIWERQDCKEKNLDVVYKNSLAQIEQKTNLSGEVILSSNNVAPFVVFEKDEQKFLLLSVDFSGTQAQYLATDFAQLESFVLSRNEQIIVVGNFELVGWSSIFKSFLDNTGLIIKNPLFSSLGNMFLPPQFYVLGYGNVVFCNQTKSFDQQGNKSILISTEI